MTLPTNSNVCPERGRLVDLLTLASSHYASLANLLSTDMGTLPKDEYAPRRRAVEEARILAQSARVALHAHTAEHGCSVNPPVNETA
jgi:hypothetical protein